MQFDHILVSGTDQSVDNYMVISSVKFTSLTNKASATPRGTGSGTFDVSWDAVFNQTGTDLTSAYSADIGRGSQITLMAHPNAGSYFDHWEDSNGTSISTDTSITVTVGDSDTDTADRIYNPVFNSGINPNVTKLLAVTVDGNSTAVGGTCSGENQTVTLKATDYANLDGCGSYVVTVNGTDVKDVVKSADGCTAPYGLVAQFEAVNTDVSQYAFQSWSTGEYSATAVIPDVSSFCGAT